MLKRHSIVLCFILSLFISTGVAPLAFAVPDIQSQNQSKIEDNIDFNSDFETDTSRQEQVKVKDLDVDPLDTVSLRKSVVPDPKQEGKKVVGLFIKSMLAVAFCAILLYIILYFVKKFYGERFVSKEYNKEVENLDLSTPETKEEAFRNFLNRTK